MQLTETSVMLSRLAMQDQADDASFMEVVNQALDAAAVHLGAQLDTEFDEGAHTDTFYIDSSIYEPVGGLYRLKLAHGFVLASTLSIYTVDDLFGASLSPVQLAAPQYRSDPKSLEKGFIDIPATLEGSYVIVSYTAGFADVSEVPAWLSEASLATAIRVMSWQQLGDDKPALGKILQEVAGYGGDILNRHMRTSSRAIPALTSE